MKKVVLGITLAIASTLSNASDSELTTFAIEQAHSKGFMGCDAAIKSAFEQSDRIFKVNANWFNELKKDSLKLTATWGSRGDSIYQEAEFRKHSGKCFMTRTTVLTSPKSCTAFASENRAFGLQAEVGDFTWMANDGGIPMVLKSLNGGCIAIFQQDAFF